MGHISVIGSGSWGTALAQSLANGGGHSVALWARDAALADAINTHHENIKYLAGTPLSENITATSNLADTCKSDIILMVTPAQAMRDILTNMKAHLNDEQTLVLCSKGLETGTGKFMSEVAADVLPNIKTAILTGPNFAIDIAKGKPAATTLACADHDLATTIQSAIASPYFRPYITNDIIGAQICGAFKNIIAIACGIAHGMDMGESARASLVTRGLAELSRLGAAMGANTETFMGLCGVGDIMLTCSSTQSRNFSFGLNLTQKIDATKSKKYVTEGIHTAESAAKLANNYGVKMPICEAVNNCLNNGHTLDEVLQALLNRPLTNE